jgi:hypothetical protein
MTTSRSVARLSLIALFALPVACTGDSSDADGSPPDSTAMAAAAERFRQQKANIDSVVTNAKPPVAVVAQELGSIYRVADDSLASVVRRESRKTYDCYTKALAELDPTLAGTANVLVNFGAAGWDLVRVEKWEFSSPAGGAVVSCINARAKAEWSLPQRGVKPGAHLVQLTFVPDTGKKQ